MPIKGEQQGYTYKALIDGEWQEVTIQESPLELAELFEQDEEWTRVRHGYWIKANDPMSSPFDTIKRCLCSECREWGTETNYCPNCGAKMDLTESPSPNPNPNEKSGRDIEE